MKEKLPFKIKCPFCNHQYTAKMEAQIEEHYGGCDNCGPESADGVLEITCDNCKKVVYRKEYKSYD